MSEEPYFDEASSTVRFWVQIDGRPFAASVRSAALHYCFRPEATGDIPMETFGMHTAEIESVVRRRVSEGAREPVMLREFDLRVGGVPKSR
ncbi:MAG: DUF1488 family protein [Burkholderiales bacterium]|nr:DUF1488 family protein [Burkholderiales bacterium]